MAPPNCVQGPQKKPGHKVQGRPDGADQMRAQGCYNNRGTRPQRRPGGRTVQGLPNGADQPACRAAEAAMAHGAVAARWRRPAACACRGGDRGTWCSDGPLAPTNCVRMPRRRRGRIVQGRPDDADQLRA
eukprot:jgi/Tetstr1/422338/TSEL_013181.t1